MIGEVHAMFEAQQGIDHDEIDPRLGQNRSHGEAIRRQFDVETARIQHRSQELSDLAIIVYDKDTLAVSFHDILRVRLGHPQHGLVQRIFS
jgi:hypothetical protein